MMEYMIVFGLDLFKLTREVNIAIQTNWIPLGGPFLICKPDDELYNKFAQAMTRVSLENK